MTREEAKEYAKDITYHDAVYNALDDPDHLPETWEIEKIKKENNI